jgi:hypothetical protein
MGHDSFILICIADILLMNEEGEESQLWVSAILFYVSVTSLCISHKLIFVHISYWVLVDITAFTFTLPIWIHKEGSTKFDPDH